MGFSEVERFPNWPMRSANPSTGTSIPLTTSRSIPAAEQSFSSAPSNPRLRASTCASTVRQFRLAREHLRLAVEPRSFDGEAERLGGRRAGPCGCAGRACGRGFVVRSQGVFACDRCSRPCARGRRPCGAVRPGCRPGFWACGCSARTWLRGGFRGRCPCRRPWPARSRRGRRS
jgi:hypothetical protein